MPIIIRLRIPVSPQMMKVIVSIIISVSVRSFEWVIEGVVFRAGVVGVWVVTIPLVSIIVIIGRHMLTSSDFPFIKVPVVIFTKWVFIVMIFGMAAMLLQRFFTLFLALLLILFPMIPPFNIINNIALKSWSFISFKDRCISFIWVGFFTLRFVFGLWVLFAWTFFLFVFLLTIFGIQSILEFCDLRFQIASTKRIMLLI